MSTDPTPYQPPQRERPVLKPIVGTVQETASSNGASPVLPRRTWKEPRPRKRGWILFLVLIAGCLWAYHERAAWSTKVTFPCDTCHKKGRLPCETCAGAGTLTANATSPCSFCGGSGQVKKRLSSGPPAQCPQCRGAGNVPSINRTTCSACDGVGSTLCPDCGGTGHVQTYRLEYFFTISKARALSLWDSFSR